MSSKERTEKRERATYKLNNQLSVLSRTGFKKDMKVISQMSELARQLS